MNSESQSTTDKVRLLWDLVRRRAREGQLGVPRQLLEMVVLKLARGMGPSYYQMAGFWRRDVPWSLKTGQFSAPEYHIALKRLNPAAYRKVSQHKVVEKAMLTFHHIPTPRYLGLLSRERGTDSAGGRQLRDAADLAGLVSRQRLNRIVMKELEGHGGKGVRVVDCHGGEPCRLSVLGREDVPVPVDEFCRDELRLGFGKEWLLEAYFDQHPVTAALNQTSVNSVRIWILLASSGEAHALTAYLRIGRGGMCVDNATSGGIVAPIDMISGALGPALDTKPQRNLYATHPDHGAPISGIVVPHWPAIQDLAKRALRVFPMVRFAGCDVAVGPDGPAILELNLCPDREGAAYTDFASRRYVV